MSQAKKVKISPQDLYLIKEMASKNWTKLMGEDLVAKSYVIAIFQHLKNTGVVELDAEFSVRKLPQDYFVED